MKLLKCTRVSSTIDRAESNTIVCYWQQELRAEVPTHIFTVAVANKYRNENARIARVL